MTKQFTAVTKKYDPDHEDEATFDTWGEASRWLLDQQRYGLCNMWINGDSVSIHHGHIVNDEPDADKPLPIESTAAFQVFDAMARATTDFNRTFRPQPTRGMAPTNPDTLDKTGKL